MLIIAVFWFVAGVVLGVTALAHGSPQWPLWPPSIGAAVTATLASVVAARSAQGATRDFWRRLGFTSAWLAAGTIGQTLDTVATGSATEMSPGTAACYLIAVSVGIHALIRLPRPKRSWRATVAMCLDVAVVAVAATIIIVHFMWSSSMSATNGIIEAVTLVVVLAAACAAVVGVIKAGITRSGAVNQRALWALTPIGLLAPIAWGVTPLLNEYPFLNPTVVTLPVAGLFFALAARFQTQANLTPAKPRPEAAERQPGHLGIWRQVSAVPYAAVAITAVLLIGVTLQVGHLPPGLAGGSVVLTLLVMVRQYAALSDNNALLDRLDEQAHHDDLTGLPNRRLFTANLARRTGTTTVAVCDLDGFAALNDSLGDEAGDTLLRAAAERVNVTAGPGAIVARLLGDEFGVLLPGNRTDIADTLLQAFRSPLRVDGHDLLVTVTVGTATGDDSAASDLLRRAELALQAAKLTGANRHREHSAELDATAQHHAELAAALRRGLENNEFRLLYQPIVELPGGAITGVEALVRWHPADGPVVSPAEFIPVAEHSGLIIDLGAWILDTACADAAGWQDRHGAAGPRVNINVSARQLLDPDLPGLVADALHRYGLAPDRITIEITETAVFAGGAALSTVRELRDLGVGVALDDFGTGHSSLTLLRTCPVTTLKVDKSFIDDLNGTAEQEAIATSLSTIASTLGLRAVAEGVETQEQAIRLHALGYRYAQGFYFARPAPANKIDEALGQPVLAL
ncbi:putative bifunctional diguanylate cyclase/phosphodiesterase [Actinoplanes sp. GCM10030250]|uniref:putative bifunctional diguanylate cyclase/phosphodiesterase n=1 Tax=Actinoplanes sp. GCM10030250 TaxID=3273376 RepID=UPI003623ADFC